MFLTKWFKKIYKENEDPLPPSIIKWNSKNIIIGNDKNCIILTLKENEIELTIKGDLSINTNGEINSLVLGGLNIDTEFDKTGNKIYLNSKMHKDLRDLPETIEWRKKQKEIAENKMKEIDSQSTQKKYIGTNK